MKLVANKDKMMTVMWCLLAAYAAFLIPADAMAGNLGSGNSSGGAIGDVLCTVVSWFTGKLGQGIATLAIIVIGIGALMGKVSWGMAIIVGIGVGVIFGAPTIVNALGGVGGC